MLFTFPSRYSYTIGLTGVFSLAGWARLIRAGLLVSRVTQDTTRPTFQTLPFRIRIPQRGPTTPQVRRHTGGLGSSPVARHYWGNHCYFLFLEVLRCFSSLGSPHHSKMVMTVLPTAGLSHSEIRGSTAICAYPRLIAAYHVLHRLREPRHPPSALPYIYKYIQARTARSIGLTLLISM